MIKKSSNKHLQFVAIVLLLTSALVLVSIAYIIDTTFAVEKDSNYQKAFEWQKRNRGVVGITVNIANVYKQRMLEWSIANKNIDSILLGSSTMMGIKEGMFKNNTIFNGALNSNILYHETTTAKYHSKYSNHIKTIIIGFDWALGLPYLDYKKIITKPGKKEQKSTPLVEKIKDAVSYQRVKIVLVNLIDKLFIDDIPLYKCPNEDTVGTDQFFNTDQPKSCHGFRSDGSAVFPGVGITEKEWMDYLSNGLTKYQKNFDKYLGTIDRKYLDDFQEINQNLQAKGGRLVILIPPLIPNATATLEVTSKKSYTTKLNKLLTFAKNNNIHVVNASKSEEFGCVYSDFLDAHHAFPSCYKKIIEATGF